MLQKTKLYGSVLPADKGYPHSHYPRAVRLDKDKLLCTFMREDPIRNGWDKNVSYYFYESMDKGRSWEFVSELDPSSAGIKTGTQGYETLFLFPEKLGDFEKGTLIFSVTNFDGIHDTIQNFRSSDQGRTWQYHSSLAPVEGTSGKLNTWEPEFYVSRDKKLVCCYSDERHAGYNQCLAIETSIDGGLTWNDHKIVVGEPDGVWRPGMPRVARFVSGKYVMVYENNGSVPESVVRLRVSEDGIDWGDPSSRGQIVASDPVIYSAACPEMVLLKTVSDGEIIFVRGMLDTCETDRLFCSKDLGESWYTVPAPLSVAGDLDLKTGYSGTLLDMGEDTMIEINTVCDNNENRIELGAAKYSFIDKDIPRPEYPRPAFRRDDTTWINLNGEWEFSFDDDTFDKKIIVPFAYQTKLSGIHNTDLHKIVWYRRSFDLNNALDKRVLIHFGAVDYECDLWINDSFVTSHVGGQTGFSADITNHLKENGNIVKIKVTDDPRDLTQPRGKQYWEKQPKGIFYTGTTGIWQTVWLELVNDHHLKSVRIDTDIDDRSVGFEFSISLPDTKEEIDLQTDISVFGEKFYSQKISGCKQNQKTKIYLDQNELGKWNFREELIWSPENPVLFEVDFKLISGGEILDEVSSYFGMRKICVENGKFMLNNREYYQKLILDQGYWPDSLMTAPDDDAFIKDIRETKDLGFNGVRKHQKVEDPRYLYHADKMGLLVWGEIGSAYVYSNKYAKQMTKEWMERVVRDHNHPCIVVWVPLNESWGVQEILENPAQQAHSLALKHLTKSLDPSRPVVTNDGWEHTDSDLLTLHDYSGDPEEILKRYSSIESILTDLPHGRQIFANGWEYKGQPVIVSEFGGIAFKAENDPEDAWGYTETSSKDDFREKYEGLLSALLKSDMVQGYCYTQLTDVEQEQNGLLKANRERK